MMRNHKDNKTVLNLITKNQIIKARPIDEEVEYDGKMMISETDKAGIITYCNRKFIEMTGFSKKELIGSPHSITRHPDMPKGVFRGMWTTIKKGRIWEGYIKSLRKDGRYYWSLVYVQPKVDAEGTVIGYTSGRKIPDQNALNETKEYYKKLFGDEHIDHKYFLNHEVHHGSGIATRENITH